MPKENTTRLAIRTPEGRLEPLETMDNDDLRHLAIEAGLLGLPLQEWVKTILRTSLREPALRVYEGPESDPSSWLTLDLEPELLDELQRAYCRNAHACSMGDLLTSYLYFVSSPAEILGTRRMAKAGVPPTEAAKRLVREHIHRMDTMLSEDQDHHEAKQARKFRELDQAGAFRGQDRLGVTDLFQRCDQAQYA